MEQVIVCTDAGLSSKTNRKFNDLSVNGERVRSFITTQSVKQLPAYLKDFALDPSGWRLPGDSLTYNLDELDEERDYGKIFIRTAGLRRIYPAGKCGKEQSPWSSI